MRSGSSGRCATTATPRARASKIRILLLDAAGKELLSATGYADRKLPQPGDISPFSVLFTDDGGPLPKYHSYRAEVRSRPADMAGAAHHGAPGAGGD